MEKTPLSEEVKLKIISELSKLDDENVHVDSLKLVPSQCYHIELNPLHVLFNTNCPDSLKKKVDEILSVHIHESAGNENNVSDAI